MKYVVKQDTFYKKFLKKGTLVEGDFSKIDPRGEIYEKIPEKNETPKQAAKAGTNTQAKAAAKSAGKAPETPADEAKTETAGNVPPEGVQE